jgi:hypothetical protein
MNNRRTHDYSQGMTQLDKFLNRYPLQCLTGIMGFIWIADYMITGGV